VNVFTTHFNKAVDGERNNKWSIPKKPVSGKAVKIRKSQYGATVPPQYFPCVYMGAFTGGDVSITI
jgi:hypothetical protein